MTCFPSNVSTISKKIATNNRDATSYFAEQNVRCLEMLDEPNSGTGFQPDLIFLREGSAPSQTHIPNTLCSNWWIKHYIPSDTRIWLNYSSAPQQNIITSLCWVVVGTTDLKEEDPCILIITSVVRMTSSCFTGDRRPSSTIVVFACGKTWSRCAFNSSWFSNCRPVLKFMDFTVQTEASLCFQKLCMYTNANKHKFSESKQKKSKTFDYGQSVLCL